MPSNATAHKQPGRKQIGDGFFALAKQTVKQKNPKELMESSQNLFNTNIKKPVRGSYPKVKKYDQIFQKDKPGVSKANETPLAKVYDKYHAAVEGNIATGNKEAYADANKLVKNIVEQKLNTKTESGIIMTEFYYMLVALWLNELDDKETRYKKCVAALMFIREALDVLVNTTQRIKVDKADYVNDASGEAYNEAGIDSNKGHLPMLASKYVKAGAETWLTALTDYLQYSNIEGYLREESFNKPRPTSETAEERLTRQKEAAISTKGSLAYEEQPLDNNQMQDFDKKLKARKHSDRNLEDNQLLDFLENGDVDQLLANTKRLQEQYEKYKAAVTSGSNDTAKTLMLDVIKLRDKEIGTYRTIDLIRGYEKMLMANPEKKYDDRVHVLVSIGKRIRVGALDEMKSVVVHDLENKGERNKINQERKAAARKKMANYVNICLLISRIKDEKVDIKYSKDKKLSAAIMDEVKIKHAEANYVQISGNAYKLANIKTDAAINLDAIEFVPMADIEIKINKEELPISAEKGALLDVAKDIAANGKTNTRAYVIKKMAKIGEKDLNVEDYEASLAVDEIVDKAEYTATEGKDVDENLKQQVKGLHGSVGAGGLKKDSEDIEKMEKQITAAANGKKYLGESALAKTVLEDNHLIQDIGHAAGLLDKKVGDIVKTTPAEKLVAVRGGSETGNLKDVGPAGTLSLKEATVVVEVMTGVKALDIKIEAENKNLKKFENVVAGDGNCLVLYTTNKKEAKPEDGEASDKYEDKDPATTATVLTFISYIGTMKLGTYEIKKMPKTTFEVYTQVMGQVTYKNITWSETVYKADEKVGGVTNVPESVNADLFGRVVNYALKNNDLKDLIGEDVIKSATKVLFGIHVNMLKKEGTGHYPEEYAKSVTCNGNKVTRENVEYSVGVFEYIDAFVKANIPKVKDCVKLMPELGKKADAAYMLKNGNNKPDQLKVARPIKWEKEKYLFELDPAADIMENPKNYVIEEKVCTVDEMKEILKTVYNGKDWKGKNPFDTNDQFDGNSVTKNNEMVSKSAAENALKVDESKELIDITLELLYDGVNKLGVMEKVASGAEADTPLAIIAKEVDDKHKLLVNGNLAEVQYPKKDE